MCSCPLVHATTTPQLLPDLKLLEPRLETEAKRKEI